MRYLLMQLTIPSVLGGLSTCHLDSLASFSATHRSFQCTSSMGTYFHLGSILVISFLFLHSIFVFWSFLWSVTGENKPQEELGSVGLLLDITYAYQLRL